MVNENVQLKRTHRALRWWLKATFQVGCLLMAFPFAAFAGFGRFARLFQFFAQFFSIIPGLPGDYLRVAYYALTLRSCALYSRVSLGSFFAQSSCTVGVGVYVGAYCVLGSCSLGDRTQIASHVQILDGGHQHDRTTDGQILGANEKNFKPVMIGEDCWIGASAIVMANVGPRTGAGAVVTRPLPAGVVAVGNPARILERPARKPALEATAARN